MKKLLALVIILFSMNSLFAQNYIDSLIWLEAEPGQLLKTQGDLTKGQPMSDLSWAWNSSVAYFPELQAEKFTGNHVLYAIDLPSYSNMEISLVPANKKTDLSIYAYMVGKVSEDNLVPNLGRCVRCEVDHKSDRRYVGQSSNGNIRIVKDILAIRNPYQVVIGVVGAKGLATGAYTLNLKVNKR